VEGAEAGDLRLQKKEHKNRASFLTVFDQTCLDDAERGQRNMAGWNHLHSSKNMKGRGEVAEQDLTHLLGLTHTSYCFYFPSSIVQSLKLGALGLYSRVWSWAMPPLRFPRPHLKGRAWQTSLRNASLASLPHTHPSLAQTGPGWGWARLRAALLHLG
jgi:hypothetical protein